MISESAVSLQYENIVRWQYEVWLENLLSVCNIKTLFADNTHSLVSGYTIKGRETQQIF